MLMHKYFILATGKGRNNNQIIVVFLARQEQN
jgi:hypothetical protein